LHAFLPLFLSGILAAELIFLLSPLSANNSLTAITPTAITPRMVGLQLFGPYLLLVEIAALLLTSAIVGAFHIGSRKQRGEK
jgi:NADH-quinone oxidoreductase subunit J